MLTVSDIPMIPGLEQMVIRTTANGMDRPIRWPYIAEDHQLAPWLKGGEVIFVTGINRQWQHSQFDQLISVAHKSGAAVIVVLTGSDFIPFLPNEWVKKCEKMGIALIEQPYSLPMVTVTEKLSNALIQDTLAQRSKQWFLQQVIETQSPAQPIVVEQASKLGLQTNVPLSVAMITPLNIAPDNIDSVLFVLRDFLNDQDSTFPLTEYRNGWLIICPALSEKLSSDEEQLCWFSLKARLGEIGCNIYIGLSEGLDFSTLYQLVYQARHCAELASTHSNNGIYYYRSFGLQQLFSAIDDYQLQNDFCRRYLGELFHCNEGEAHQIKRTLHVYFEQLASLRKTAQALGIHRNTVSSRLHRFETLTSLSLSDPFQRLGVQNALLMESLIATNSKNLQGRL